MTVEAFVHDELIEREYLIPERLQAIPIEMTPPYVIVVCPRGCTGYGRRTFHVPLDGRLEISAEPEVEF